MDFTTRERNTIIAALKGLLVADPDTRTTLVLSGGLGKPEEITELIERLEEEGQT